MAILDRGRLAGLVLAVLPGALAAQGIPDSARIALNRVFANWTATDSPGCAVGVARNGAPVFLNGYGMANLELEVPITPATIFHVASVSKQFTAMAILLLAADGPLLAVHVPPLEVHHAIPRQPPQPGIELHGPRLGETLQILGGGEHGFLHDVRRADPRGQARVHAAAHHFFESVAVPGQQLIGGTAVASGKLVEEGVGGCGRWHGCTSS